MEIIQQQLQSIITFCKLVFSGSLHNERTHLLKKLKAPDGKTYEVFRETISSINYHKDEVTLVVGFRLFIIGDNPFFHYLFQKLCVLDTPIWVGFDGFRKKFWMVDQRTKNYSGVYQYQGRINAQKYADYITSVLKPVSVKGSVWSEIITTNFENYTKKIAVK